MQVVRLCLRHAFRSLPAFVAMALGRTIANAWPTSRREARLAELCLLRCSAVGDDAVRHYVVCPLPDMHMVVKLVKHLLTPPWQSFGSAPSPSPRLVPSCRIIGCIWCIEPYPALGTPAS